MKIIACVAQKQSGKDTLANYLLPKLQEALPEHNWHRGAFANAVKDTFCDAFSVDRDFIEEWKERDDIPPGFDMPMRKSLQFIGDGFRKIRDRIWIEIAFRNEADKSPIISDGRYINEIKEVHERGGVNILLWRENFENDDPNPSESQIKPLVDWFVWTGREGVVKDFPITNLHPLAQYIDIFIRSEGTIGQLYTKADEIILPFIQEHCK